MAALSLYFITDMLTRGYGNPVGYESQIYSPPRSSNIDSDYALNSISDYHKKVQRMEDDSGAQWHKPDFRALGGNKKVSKNYYSYNTTPVKNERISEAKIKDQVVRTKGNYHLKSETLLSGNNERKKKTKQNPSKNAINAKSTNKNKKSLSDFKKGLDQFTKNDASTSTVAPEQRKEDDLILVKSILHGIQDKQLDTIIEKLDKIMNNQTSEKQVELIDFVPLKDNDDKGSDELVKVEHLSYDNQYDRYKYETDKKE